MTAPAHAEIPQTTTERSIFSFPVAVASVEEMSAHLIERALTATAPCAVAAADVHVITRGVHEKDYGEVLRNMDIICPDGMPIVWKLNRRLTQGAKTAARISGPDLMDAMLQHSCHSPEIRHFLLGGDKETLEKLTANLNAKHPGFNLAGVFSPPFREWTDDDLADMRRAIADSGANVIWVGLGCPKQERWMAQQKELLPPGVYVGVGAAFAFHAGTVKRAPLWMQKHGLEWFYRLCREPGRLFKRYLKHNSLFIWYLLTGK